MASTTTQAAVRAGPKEAIRNCAIELFGKQGYTGTSMRDIAKAVGVLPGSLYAHIESKEALLIEIVEDGIERFVSRVAPYVSSTGPSLDRLRAMIVAHVEVVADHPERSLVVFHQWRFLGEENMPLAIERRREYERCFVDVLEQGIREGTFKNDLNPRVAVLTILGALNWTPEWLSPHGRLSPAEIGEIMAGTLLGGIRTQAHS